MWENRKNWGPICDKNHSGSFKNSFVMHTWRSNGLKADVMRSKIKASAISGMVVK